MMSKTLLIFLLSDKIDAYVNAITYNFDNLKVKTVIIVHIKGAETDVSNEKATDIYDSIWHQIESLSRGEYINFIALNNAKKTSSVLPLPKQILQSNKTYIYRQVYEQILDRQLKPLEYSNLKRDLKLLIRGCGGAKNCIVDITAASKVMSIEIFSMCLALGIQSVFTFELKNNFDPQRPEESLYHNLASGSYNYTLISAIFTIKDSQRSLLRKEELLWFVVGASLLLMSISLYIYLTSGIESLFLQLLNILAAVIGVLTPLYSLVTKRR